LPSNEKVFKDKIDHYEKLFSTKISKNISEKMLKIHNLTDEEYLH